jgi:hypothetical protein
MEVLRCGILPDPALKLVFGQIFDRVIKQILAFLSRAGEVTHK